MDHHEIDVVRGVGLGPEDACFMNAVDCGQCLPQQGGGLSQPDLDGAWSVYSTSDR